VTDPDLTAVIIAAAMAKAEARVCVGSDRCFAFPDLLVDARQTCPPKGRCKVGWIVWRGGRESWDVWLEVATGRGCVSTRSRHRSGSYPREKSNV
jgi:hypothetical protein